MLVAEELAAATEQLPNSVAVLPFENLSSDLENAYFAAGIHEVILNQLAKIGDLNVIVRTTMMLYADGDQPIDVIADELNVETVMEGSVRYAGGRLLITAQLIDPATSVPLWSGSYNRQLADIFNIQPDVATNIASALEAEFSIAEQDLVAKLPTESLEAYAIFLQANQAPFREKVGLLSDAIAIDPEFALALGRRAWARTVLPYFSGGGETSYIERQEIRDDAKAALAIEPTIGIAHAALGILNTVQWRAEDARESFTRALALQPSEPDVLAFYSLCLSVIGETGEAIEVGQRAVALDPSNSLSHILLGHTYFVSEDYAEARVRYETARTINPNPISNVLARVRYAFTEIYDGRNDDALELLRLLESDLECEDQGTYMRPNIALAYSKAGSLEDARRVFDWLERNSDTSADLLVRPEEWVIAYLVIGDYDEALKRASEVLDSSFPGTFALMSELWMNLYKIPVLDTDPRWPELRARGGFDL
ncbi:MAG: tetratricopeptide repeat protein [Candidatus Rariloculaceae bacterium]